MPLTTPPDESTPIAARRVRSVFSRQPEHLERIVRRLAVNVERYGRSEVDAALGEDASDLPTLYNALKAAAEAFGVTDLPDLPGA